MAGKVQSRGPLAAFGLYGAWLVSVVATLGSLFFSEVWRLIPCTLCWYQRILMYPLAVILGMASFRDDAQIVTYILPLSIGGMAIAAYHYAMQMVPALADSSLCRAGIPCGEPDLNLLGFINIPTLSLVAFALITYLLWRTAAERQVA